MIEVILRTVSPANQLEDCEDVRQLIRHAPFFSGARIETPEFIDCIQHLTRAEIELTHPHCQMKTPKVEICFLELAQELVRMSDPDSENHAMSPSTEFDGFNFSPWNNCSLL